MIEKLKNNIYRFESAQNTFSNDGLYKALLDVVMTEEIPSNIGGWRIGTFPMSRRMYPKGTKFCRVRKLEFNKHEFTYDDFWEPPKKYINAGRINKKSEQLLYMTEGEVASPMEEVGIQPEDNFIIMFYEAKNDISFTEIGWDIIKSETHGEVGLLIKKFLDRNFSKKGSDAYRLSEVIAKNINISKSPGWCYPSVARRGGINICLKIENKPMLELFGVQCCYMPPSGTFKTEAVCDIKNTERIRMIVDKNEVDIMVERIFDRFKSPVDSSHLKNYNMDPQVEFIIV